MWYNGIGKDNEDIAEVRREMWDNSGGHATRILEQPSD